MGVRSYGNTESVARVTIASLIGAAFALAFTGEAAAATPETVVYTGSLSADGEPVDTLVEATFQLYGDQTGGDPLWEESFEAVDVTEGHFTVQLGGTNSLEDVFSDSENSSYWIEVEINGETLKPRTPLGSVPFAMRAKTCESCGSNSNDGDGSTSEEIAALKERIRKLEQKTAKMKVGASDDPSFDDQGIGSDVADDGSNVEDVYYEGVNVHVRHGEGSPVPDPDSDSSYRDLVETNGTGNVIIGYDDKTGTGAESAGSHNLVVGSGHSYTASAYGGVVTGWRNVLDGLNAVVLGGRDNEATNRHASVCGGSQNTASGKNASVAGGFQNEATGNQSTVSGGFSNTSSGEFTTVDGGKFNEAVGEYAFIGGGSGNESTGKSSTVTGGNQNTASGRESTVSGGSGNTASGSDSKVSGGRNNKAEASRSVVSGGSRNVASESYACVSGGVENTASGYASTVSGGKAHVASEMRQHLP